MFAKLLKHEWQANSKLLGGLTLATLGIGVIAAFFLRVLVNYGDEMSYSDNVMVNLMLIGLVLGLLFCFVGLCLYAVAVQFILLYRFYKHKFTDEGYLTFTLPVSTLQIFWSSLVNMLIWLIISFTVIFTVIFLVILFGTATRGLVNTDIFRLFGEMWDMMGAMDWEMVYQDFVDPTYILSVVIYLLQLVIAPFYALIIPMACITIGAVLAKKHKLAAAIGVYYGLNMVVSFVSSMMSMIPSFTFSMSGSADFGGYYLAMMLLSFLLTAGLTVGGYFTTTYLMKHKLNLP